jgi:hypothetical protein
VSPARSDVEEIARGGAVNAARGHRQGVREIVVVLVVVFSKDKRRISVALSVRVEACSVFEGLSARPDAVNVAETNAARFSLLRLQHFTTQAAVTGHVAVGAKVRPERRHRD